VDDNEKRIIEGFEELGEQKVLWMLQRGNYSGDKLRLAEAWVEAREVSRNRRSNADTLKIAKDAKIIAIISVIITTIGVIISIVMSLRP
jgi:hypothetical protein